MMACMNCPKPAEGAVCAECELLAATAIPVDENVDEDNGWGDDPGLKNISDDLLKEIEDFD